MLKNLLRINAALRILFLSETPPGSVHDKRIADTTPYPLPAGSQLLQDLGFQAFTLAGVDIIQPTKKPRGKALTPEQQADNREIARRRVRIEHVAASGKFESERLCADKRVTTSCDGGCSYFCSSLLLETLICGPSHCTFPMTRSLP
jgi:DDE superfamily endonuclease